MSFMLRKPMIATPTAVTGPAAHSPAGGVAPPAALKRTGKHFVGHSVHQHRALQGRGASLGSVK